MRGSVFHVEPMQMTTLQAQIREVLVAAILAGQLAPGAPVPSTRAMAKRLRVSRNTVTLAYQALASDGYLSARERSGFYVAAGLDAGHAPRPQAPRAAASAIDWQARLAISPGRQANIEKPANWQEYPYPFVYGQIDPALFPIAAWRDCVRQAMSRQWLDAWTADRFARDDAMLVDQIRKRILPRRAVAAGEDEILVTLGAQNALFLLAQLLVGRRTRVAVEDPGYPDLRNMLALRTGALRPLPVDGDGLRVELLRDAEIACVTPCHQFPTGVTMSRERRRALIDWAERRDGLVIEDDYDAETTHLDMPAPALKSLDASGRVLYVGSLSKSLMPGLRIGFLVAPAPLIAELRALRRLMLRHPPGNNQRVLALFLALGHHDALLARLHRVHTGRRLAMLRALEAHLPGWAELRAGGTAFWLRAPDGLDAAALAAAALAEGVVIEPGGICFAEPGRGRSRFRLGFSSIGEERIEPGIARLAGVAAALLGTRRRGAP